MTFRTAILSGILLLFGSSVYAQETHRIEVFGEYSYLRLNPSLSYLKNRSFNGGGGGVQFNFNPYFGVKVELMGYDSTSYTIPAGTYLFPKLDPIPITLHAPIKTQGNMFTYLIGPVIKFSNSRVSPFGELLFGGSNTNFYGNQALALCTGLSCQATARNLSGAQHPFTMAVGGGIDIKMSHGLSIRPIEIDYILSRYTNPLTLTNNQNSFRFSAGLVFHF